MLKPLLLTALTAITLTTTPQAAADTPENQYLNVIHRYNIPGDNQHLIDLGRGACNPAPWSYAVQAYQASLTSEGYPLKPDALVIVSAGITAFCPDKKPAAYSYMS